ncbi:MAG: glycosyltransferase, partial [Gammaproteobacteria bacterium]|nr:glycosyltransferase [Gammaproteobacteria bacterium]
TPENAAHVLVEAFLRTRTTLRLVIVGDAPYVQKYKTWLKGLCDDRIVMPGYQFGENYRQLSMNCRYFVLPSGIDGTRPVLLDQMGFGNCVVVKDAPANVEVVGDAGVLFEKENEVESLRSTIERLDQDFETIERCRAAGLERVRKYYSWDTITDQYETLFRQMASERAEET